VATGEALERMESAPPNTVLIDRLQGVLRTTGVISAALREKRGDNSLVDLNAPYTYSSKYIF
jgi:hypothetical protein